jgi:dihydropyrimidinase
VAGGRVAAGDLLLEGERILAVGDLGGAPGADRVLDADGCYVLPGLMDFHTHLDDRIGRFDLADTCLSGSRVAVANGITTLFAFVTQGPEETLALAVDRALDKARCGSWTDLGWHLTPTRLDEAGWRDVEAHLARGFRTLKFYTTYRAAGIFSGYDDLAAIFDRLAGREVRILVHAEDDALMAALVPAGLDRAIQHARLRPPEAEALAVDRLLSLASRASLHLVHVSTPEAARAIGRARARQDVSCETCPQYLWLDEAMLARPDGHRWICSPPLRRDREAFRDLARAGAFDLYATDHCAFLARDKDDWDGTDFRQVPNGLPGLGALPHLVWRLFGDDPDRAALELARRCAENPARLAGIGHRKGALRPGLDADIAILDPAGPLRPLRSSLAEVHEPYPLETSPLRFRHVLLRGRPVVEEGAFLPVPPMGRALCQEGRA